jgi:diketogulonate reductase-like aldo/keto reductase
MTIIFTAFFLPFYLLILVQYGESLSPPEIGRRDAISKAAAAASIAISLKPSNAVSSDDPPTTTISSRNVGVETEIPIIHTIRSIENPPPILSLPMKSPSMPTPTTLDIPRVGYSFYKTAADKAERCAALALRSGVTHLDIATQYESNAEIGKTIRTYLRYGPTKLALDEKPELLELMDASYKYRMSRIQSKSKKRGSGRRREELFLSHKISNEEQSIDPDKIRRAILETMDTLGVEYLDMVSVHSPLTNSETRLAAYRALVDLQQRNDRKKSSPIIRSIGVCNYGLGPLKEIVAAGLPLPVVNQLELSPFNGHKDVVEWCDRNGVAVSCAAWSKLSGASGPGEQWDVLSQIANKKGVTKAQALVRWSLQKGYICVPRSGCAYKIERVAIAENSYGGGVVIKEGKLTTISDAGGEESAMLTPEEMTILDGLDVNYKAGKLGRRDGWNDADVTGVDWDPTDAI